MPAAGSKAEERAPRKAQAAANAEGFDVRKRPQEARRPLGMASITEETVDEVQEALGSDPPYPSSEEAGMARTEAGAIWKARAGGSMDLGGYRPQEERWSVHGEAAVRV